MKPHEQKDFNARSVQWVGAALVIILVAIGVLLFFYQKHLVKDFGLVEEAPRLSPRAQKEFDSGEIRRNLELQQSQALNIYQWRNDEHSLAHVPVERAMREILRQGSTDPEALFPSGSRRGQ